MDDAAVDGRDPGQDRFVERARQRRKLAGEFVQGGFLRLHIGLQMPHGMPRDFVVETVENDKDDVVTHGTETPYIGNSKHRNSL
ncbi:hypothetical protein D3C81_1924600 [compost metagenome]